MKAELIKHQADTDAAMALRFEVFVDEQKVPAEEERDEFEESCRHFIVKDEKGAAIGTARWRTTAKGVKLERFAVHKNWRGKGIGSLLVKAVLEDVVSFPELTKKKKYMHAQLDAVPLYAKFGFLKTGEPFDECGIMHYLMEKY
ncbi:GNAT family N-acetyltransferase [Cytophagales bacterium LB-30]|uniref:GNAT family N-acetyltransferase n=1 Tax=Shiella aurantiaca TaxID=3058365 RepID=A0ABT8F7W6_9BACT|nr:GNAT family N-acetyltransferase [Shiella aurantiaca]MDN4166532.1 GNAT family N-acetyltransferase [Shiella aurantiaca]